ncbi:hypothetical protein [uncultured Tateyamaria sp.]|uniref:hypothetical protein n=1 Tax=uncultured Tateyamaria sp. TaxID=455651 RepID=UPI002622612F|nr:hypothetical protein [uncultured Tateyamaria sp.]
MMRMLSALLLSLVLAVTSHSAGMARGASTAVDQIVICTGFGATVIHMDADGQPTQAPHLCPDCVVHLLAVDVPTVKATPLTLRVRTEASGLHDDLLAVMPPLIVPPARAPPA